MPIIQGGTFSFIGPIFALMSLPRWKCPAAGKSINRRRPHGKKSYEVAFLIIPMTFDTGPFKSIEKLHFLSLMTYEKGSPFSGICMWLKITGWTCHTQVFIKGHSQAGKGDVPNNLAK